MTVSGRVSDRVHRLVLEWPGHTEEARLDNGAFGLVTPPGARVTPDAQMVSYDTAGTVLYGSGGPDCQAADPWSPPPVGADSTSRLRRTFIRLHQHCPNPGKVRASTYGNEPAGTRQGRTWKWPGYIVKPPFSAASWLLGF